jgi:hypothetical protein
MPRNIGHIRPDKEKEKLLIGSPQAKQDSQKFPLNLEK